MRRLISDAEAKEAGVKKEVFQDWTDVMQALWEASIIAYKSIPQYKLYPRQEKNEIFLGDRFTINATMCNDSFVEARLFKGKTQLAEIRYMGDVNIICKCLFTIVVDLVM